MITNNKINLLLFIILESNSNYFQLFQLIWWNTIAVSGNITLQRLKMIGIKVDNDIVLADPGIFSPFLIQMNNININRQNYELCVIPHLIDKGNQLDNL